MAKIKILVAVVQKNVVAIDADGLAKTRLVAHLTGHGTPLLFAEAYGFRVKEKTPGKLARGSVRFGMKLFEDANALTKYFAER